MNGLDLRCLVFLAAFGFALPGPPVFGQPAEQEKVLEEVHVFGTRIVRANQVSASPITQINRQEITMSGVTRIEDLLQNYPQVQSEQNSSTLLFETTGIASIGLRNMGAKRSLVLLDGKRLPSGSPLSAGVADLNQIPVASGTARDGQRDLVEGLKPRYL